MLTPCLPIPFASVCFFHFLFSLCVFCPFRCNVAYCIFACPSHVFPYITHSAKLQLQKCAHLLVSMDEATREILVVLLLSIPLLFSQTQLSDKRHSHTLTHEKLNSFRMLIQARERDCVVSHEWNAWMRAFRICTAEQRGKGIKRRAKQPHRRSTSSTATAARAFSYPWNVKSAHNTIGRAWHGRAVDRQPEKWFCVTSKDENAERIKKLAQTKTNK